MQFDAERELHDGNTLNRGDPFSIEVIRLYNHPIFKQRTRRSHERSLKPFNGALADLVHYARKRRKW